ncbi:hypothetical protein DB347_21425 [Opitutaceae bacterium EW11]|nr:hypothetical protein DB347_21425 [Opitutaceae bacterium EW11]
MTPKRSGMVLFIAAALAAAVPLFSQTPGAALPPLKPITSVRKLAPVYPLDLLLKGKTGSAEVRFMVDYSGRAVMTTVSSATSQAFGQSLLAEIESNEFMPERINGQPQLTLTGERYNFDGEGALDAAEKRVLNELKKAPASLVSAKELDKPLTQTRKDPPAYPYALQSDGISGRAEIEFIVDRDGNAMFPRIVNASQDDFGWAAATAIQRWRFQPPTKNGQKVDARATVVVNFDNTKGTVTW